MGRGGGARFIETFYEESKSTIFFGVGVMGLGDGRRGSVARVSELFYNESKSKKNF